jgi:hypothetical protein
VNLGIEKASRLRLVFFIAGVSIQKSAIRDQPSPIPDFE